MARYQMEGGTVVDTANATAHWDEDTRWDGHNHISVATGSQWDHQTLYRSRKGRYYLVSSSQWQGSRPSAEWVSPQEAVRWLLANGHSQTDEDWPAELTQFVDDVTE